MPVRCTAVRILVFPWTPPTSQPLQCDSRPRLADPLLGSPWGIVLVLVVLQLAATAVWRVYRSPELMERWLEIWDKRRDKTP